MVNIKKMTTAFLSLVMSTSMALAELPEDYTVEDVPTHYVGETIDSVIREYLDNEGNIISVRCREYEVQPGDSPCSISKHVMSKEYDVEPTEHYWPVFCFFNGYPGIILQPGQTVYYPETLEDCENIYNYLKEEGIVDFYYETIYDVPKQNQSTIGSDDEAIIKRIRGSFMTEWNVVSVLDEIYGPGSGENSALRNAYLNAVNMSNYVNTVLEGLDGDKNNGSGIYESLNNEEVFMLTDWIPTKGDLVEHGYQLTIK